MSPLPPPDRRTLAPPHASAPPAAPQRDQASRWFWPGVLVVALVAGIGAYRLAAPATARQAALVPPSASEPMIAEPLPADGAPAADDALLPVDSSPTTVSPGEATIRCTSDLGWQLDYPADWYTVDCMLFAPWPLQDGTGADAPVFVTELPGTWDEVIGAATPDDREVTDLLDTTIAGRRALVVASRQTGSGSYEVGTLVYEIYLDDGERVLVCSTAGLDDELATLAAVVDLLVASITT